MHCYNERIWNKSHILGDRHPITQRLSITPKALTPRKPLFWVNRPHHHWPLRTVLAGTIGFVYDSQLFTMGRHGPPQKLFFSTSIPMVPWGSLGCRCIERSKTLSVWLYEVMCWLWKMQIEDVVASQLQSLTTSGPLGRRIRLLVLLAERGTETQC